ncbi:MAG: AraC family ligand binding domain-containing protein [Tannerella sp.]|jgi:quercetin dioxygenase-like cupin family protein|nr:AraC family ligand binding domain-containing protein [Tannerella sp.]
MKKLTFLLLSILISSYSLVKSQSIESVNDETTFLEKVLSEKVYFIDRQVDIDTLIWNPHPAFKGVFLKHLVTGKDTDNALSCHIVKIESNCILDTHLHDGKIEIHEVISGSGMISLDNKEISYSTGRICIIPANTLHKVVAGKDGLYLFAKFTPAL